MKDIVIRAATVSDAHELLAIYAPYVTDTAITFEYSVPSIEEFEQRMRSTLEKYPYLVAEQDGKIVGYAYATAFRVRAAYIWSVETSIYVRGDAKRRGIGAALYAALEERLAKQHITNIYACIAVPCGEDPYLTRDSVRFHERLGYRHVGEYEKCANKFGRWYSMVMMEKIIADHSDPQPEFIPFPMVDK